MLRAIQQPPQPASGAAFSLLAAARAEVGGIKGLLKDPPGSKDSPGEDKKELRRTFIDEDMLLVHTKERNCKY